MIHSLPNNFFAVQVKKHARDFELNKNSLIYLYGIGGVNKVGEILLSEGSYQIVGMADKITEEQAGDIVEKVVYRKFMSKEIESIKYNDYGSDRVDALRPTALESFRSLLSSLSLESNTLIIKKV